VSDFVSTSNFDADGLIAYCVNYVAELLDRPAHEIDPKEKFSRIGFDSAMSVQLILALEAKLGIELSPDLIASYPSIARLVAHLAEARAKDA
jgi:acyl carrier protein